MATFQVPGEDGCITVKAYTDLSANQYHGMKWASSGTVTVGDANGDLPAGILINKPAAAGEDARIFTAAGGICPVICGEAITPVGVGLTLDANGHFVMGVAADVIWGYATETTGTAGDLCKMLVISPVPIAATTFIGNHA